jgi:hypothetical protein
MAWTLQKSMWAPRSARLFTSRRNAMKATVIIKDLPRRASDAPDAQTLSVEQMKTLRGGRSVVVTVDGNRTGHVDDWDINTAIFEGRIGGTYL